MKNAEEYAHSILTDEPGKLISEVPTVYETHQIERIYTFKDGAVVKYEWQSMENPNSNESFNHRFTLVQAPIPNLHNLSLGIIKVINYSTR